MNIVLNSPNSIKILNTYAPHMGYEKGWRSKYRVGISGDLETKKNIDCIVWRTDNNGQISNEGGNNLKAKNGIGR